jgi:hypothetical protein
MHRDVAGHDALSRPPSSSIATTTPCRMLLETGRSRGGGNGPQDSSRGCDADPFGRRLRGATCS